VSAPSRLVRALLIFFALISATACAADSAALTAARQADQNRIAAMVAGDAAALGAFLSDDLRFVHSDGRIESKADYVKNLLAGDTQYADARSTVLETQQPAGDNLVILIGAQEMRKRLGPAWSDVKLRYLAVWRREGAAWRLVTWQSMRPAGNSTVPPKK
jgi:ketosteroid isomerase-like protein